MEIVCQNSHVHGRGVFTQRAFKKGEVILRWENSREISQAEFEALPYAEQMFIDRQDGKILFIGEPERYVNHSCDANAIPGYRSDIAARDIQAGEEITTDYNNFFVRTPFECHCGSANCRKLISGKLKA